MPIDITQYLTGKAIPSVSLASTDGADIALGSLKGITVLYAYPRTSPPNQPPVEGWDEIPGARGCTPQSTGFASHSDAILSAGASQIFGVSTQSTKYQSEVVERLRLPFHILSDEKLRLANALGLPIFEAGGMKLLTRITLIIEEGIVRKVFLPIQNPENNAAEVLSYLSELT